MIAERLRQDACAEQKPDPGQRDAEVEPHDAVHNQGREHRNLIQPWIGHLSGSSERRTIEPGFLAWPDKNVIFGPKQPIRRRLTPPRNGARLT